MTTTFNWRDVVRTCIADDTHLTDCDRDGYCNFCGYQEGWDYDNGCWLPEEEWEDS